jgi:low affinity Fe/Cu permease
MDAETQIKINEKLRTMQSNEKKIKIANKRIAVIEEMIKKYTNQNNRLKEEVNKLIGESSLQMNLP